MLLLTHKTPRPGSDARNGDGALHRFGDAQRALPLIWRSWASIIFLNV